MKRSLIGVLAISLVACFSKAQKDATRAAVQTLVSVCEVWVADHPGKCPTVAQLEADQAVAESSKETDSWGTPYRIQCNSARITVTSAGPDKAFDTADDILSSSK